MTTDHRLLPCETHADAQFAKWLFFATLETGIQFHRVRFEPLQWTQKGHVGEEYVLVSSQYISCIIYGTTGSKR